MTNDTMNWPNVTPPPPVENSPSNTSNHLILGESAKPEGFFSGDNLPTVPDNTGLQQATTRFQRGVSGNPLGRPRGARNKLTELFLNTVINDFAEYGADTLVKLREKDPAMYIKFIAVLLPKSLIHKYEVESDADYANMTQEEVVQLLDDIQRRRKVEKMIEVVSK